MRRLTLVLLVFASLAGSGAEQHPGNPDPTHESAPARAVPTIDLDEAVRHDGPTELHPRETQEGSCDGTFGWHASFSASESGTKSFYLVPAGADDPCLYLVHARYTPAPESA